MNLSAKYSDGEMVIHDLDDPRIVIAVPLTDDEEFNKRVLDPLVERICAANSIITEANGLLKFVVVSSNNQDDEVFDDVVFAADAGAAVERIRKLRYYSDTFEAYTAETYIKGAIYSLNMTYEQSEKVLAEIAA